MAPWGGGVLDQKKKYITGIRNKTSELARRRVDWTQHKPLAPARGVAKNTNWVNDNSILITVIPI
jgi:hypothetical protein